MPDPDLVDDVARWLDSMAAGRGDPVAIAIRPDVGLGLAVDGTRHRGVPCADPVALVDRLEQHLGPRWVWWDRTTADVLAERGVEIGRCWDVLTVHRLLAGVWDTSIARCWAWLHDLDPGGIPAMGQLDLLAGGDESAGDGSQPVRPDGHLAPEWVSGGWAADVDRLADWAALASLAVDRQCELLAGRPNPGRARSTAHAESAAEFLCAELEVHGLPIDVAEAGRIIEDAVGPKPADDAEAADLQRARDAAVLQHVEPGPPVDLRNPADVKAMLRRVAVDVPDTRAWRLEQHRATHPVVPALLAWRKAERLATTYGHRWLEEHVHDGRLHGRWSSSDGAAGRMTASAGLHNLPAEMRPAVAAEPGHVFVRADLGQIEPRVLAAVSGD
ncbi:MAG: DNA polymerase I, partial [Ilumatobacter sp.]|nr:DNA polymerase I [Ilumatobacter sp.]